MKFHIRSGGEAPETIVEVAEKVRGFLKDHGLGLVNEVEIYSHGDVEFELTEVAE